LDSQIERVGEFLKIDAVFVENESNNPKKFKEAIEKIIKKIRNSYNFRNLQS